jgi:L-ascorbate 6-phosphate lactonase
VQIVYVVKTEVIVINVEPCLSITPSLTRISESPLPTEQDTNADLILCTHEQPSHMDAGTLPAMLKASPRARVVLPKSTADHASSIGIPYDRMTTTDSGLRVEFFKGGPYSRVYSVPSAHPELSWNPIGGYPYLGYMMRFGEHTIYHAGDCRHYDGIVDRVRPYNVTAALLPIGGENNFDIIGAAQFAEDIHARWLIPMHYGTFAGDDTEIGRFVDHMLGFRPSIGFKVFESGERWIVP